MEVIMNDAFSFLISLGIIALAFGLSRRDAAGSPLVGSWDYLPSLWVRSAFIKQLAISESRRLERTFNDSISLPSAARNAGGRCSYIMKLPWLSSIWQTAISCLIGAADGRAKKHQRRLSYFASIPMWVERRLWPA